MGGWHANGQAALQRAADAGAHIVALQETRITRAGIPGMTQAARRMNWPRAAIASAGVVTRGGVVGIALAAREPVSLLDVRAIQEE
eukprot:4542834-Alexandrium_andersonii.AAC.1